MEKPVLIIGCAMQKVSIINDYLIKYCVEITTDKGMTYELPVLGYRRYLRKIWCG